MAPVDEAVAAYTFAVKMRQGIMAVLAAKEEPTRRRMAGYWDKLEEDDD